MRVAVTAVQLELIVEQLVAARRQNAQRIEDERACVAPVFAAPLPIQTCERVDRVAKAAAREESTAAEVHREAARAQRARAAVLQQIRKAEARVRLQRLERVDHRRIQERALVVELLARVHELAEEPHATAARLDEQARLQRQRDVMAAQAGCRTKLVGERFIARALLHAKLHAGWLLRGRILCVRRARAGDCE